MERMREGDGRRKGERGEREGYWWRKRETEGEG